MPWIENLPGSACWICRQCGETMPWQQHKWSGLREDEHLCQPLKEILDRALDFVEIHKNCKPPQ